MQSSCKRSYFTYFDYSDIAAHFVEFFPEEELNAAWNTLGLWLSK